MRWQERKREATLLGRQAGRVLDLEATEQELDARLAAEADTVATELTEPARVGARILLLGFLLVAVSVVVELSSDGRVSPEYLVAALSVGGLLIVAGTITAIRAALVSAYPSRKRIAHQDKLRLAFLTAANGTFAPRRLEFRKEQAAEAERLARIAATRPPAPDPQPFGVSHEGAEHLCAAWMRHLGATDAHVTRYSSDGGIDIESRAFVAQVKNYAGSVPVGDIRALFGVATAEGKTPILFTSGTLTQDGYTFADRVGIIALHYDAIDGTIRGLNEPGAFAVRNGLPGT